MVATVHVYWFISIEIDERVVQFVVKQMFTYFFITINHN